MRFTLYGREAFAGIEWDDLVAEQNADLNLWAHVEHSGSEGVYLEVAKWNDKSQRWERYAFLKFESDERVFDLADELNIEAPTPCIVHTMPNYAE